MIQKNTNSRRAQEKDQLKKKNDNKSALSTDQSQQKPGDAVNDDQQLEDFYSDEEPENFESQKEDMKMYLNKLNKRIDLLVDALKDADAKMSQMGDQKAIMDQINMKKPRTRRELVRRRRRTQSLSSSRRKLARNLER